MGWGRMLLLGNVGQQMDLDDVQADLLNLRRELNGLHGWGTANAEVDRKQNERIRDLQKANDELRLCVATLARLLVSKGVVSRDELLTLVSAIEKPD
ncbi:MAG: hypothetical protein QM783_17505 [Phycisphaerales bacterium]